MSSEFAPTGGTLRIGAISASLNPKSKSRQLLRHVTGLIEREGVEIDWIGLDSISLPFCDGGACYQDPVVQETGARVAACHGIMIGSPVYNYDLNAVAKNFLELTGSSWENKPVAFVLSAGGTGSYMSPTSFANSLWLDYHCYLYPHFLYGLGRDFDEGRVVSPEVLARAERLAHGFPAFVQGLQPVPATRPSP